MEDEVEVEGCRRIEQQVEDVVGVKGQEIRIAGERLTAPGREVPIRDRAVPHGLCGESFDRKMRRKVVAEKKEEVAAESDREQRQGERGAEDDETLSAQSGTRIAVSCVRFAAETIRSPPRNESIRSWHVESTGERSRS